jgi:tripeptidyl-peptidase I
MKLAMQGVTVVVSSGDSGVAARGADGNHTNGCLGNGEVYNPDFPTSCPYIVSAGATYLPLGANVHTDAEVAVTRFPSGGGFSNVYPRPSYQNAAVQTYLQNYVPPYKSYSLTKPTSDPTEAQTKGGIYNRAGRGYPDISAIGDNVVIILNGSPVLIGGTSASAPAIAAIFNRINEERLSRGMSPVGWVHPTIYAHPEAFHDITVGNNSGCNTEGFVASKGWDPVTGLGTPNYPKLLQVFLGSK